jgi:hypothetical protein
LCDDLIDAEKNASTLGAALVALMGDHARREAMRGALVARAREDAALEIAKIALEIAR